MAKKIRNLKQKFYLLIKIYFILKLETWGLQLWTNSEENG